MQYDKKEYDFIDRCDENLKYIEAAKSNCKEVYETTQLIANFIAILIIYKENFWIDKSPIENNNLSCEIIGENTYNDNLKENTYLFINHLRNACCHDGIEVDKSTKEIEYITFKDVNINNMKEKVKIRMSVDEIRNVYDYLVEIKKKLKKKQKRY